MTSSERALSPEERLALAVLAAREPGVVGTRARAILAWHAAGDPARAAAETGLTPAQVRHWVRAFGRTGLAVFLPGVPSIGPSRPAEGAPAAVPPPLPALSAPPPRPRPRGPRIRAGDPVGTVWRRLLAYQFAKVRRLERSALAADEEAVHDMRVAIRRLRAALRIARPFFQEKLLEAVRGRLQETARALGAVRDLDVILGHAREYAARQPEAGGDLEAWLEALAGRREEAVRLLREHLQGKRFRRFRQEVRAFLAEADREAAGGPGTISAGQARVRDVLPAVLWAQYSAVRAHEVVAQPTPESLHALRIEFKRLRYLLEFFQGALGARTIPAIEIATRAQDQLGRLHDAWVAAEMLSGHLTAAGSPDAAARASAEAYLAELRREVVTLAETFPALWREIADPPFRQRLARLLARL